jgi:hypothetical protein
MKKLACRLGRHKWTMRVEGGEECKVCAACGKMAPEPRPVSVPEQEAKIDKESGRSQMPGG